MGFVQAPGAEIAAHADISLAGGLMRHSGGVGFKWYWRQIMEAVQQQKESLKELHVLKAARDEFAIVFITCLDAVPFPTPHNPKEDS